MFLRHLFYIAFVSTSLCHVTFIYKGGMRQGTSLGTNILNCSQMFMKYVESYYPSHILVVIGDYDVINDNNNSL